MAVAPWALEVERFTEARAPELQSLFAALQSGKSSDDPQSFAESVELPRRFRRRSRSHNRYKHLFWKDGKSNVGKGSARKEEASAADGKEEAEKSEESKAKKRELKLASLSRRVRRRIEFQGVIQGTGGCCKDGTLRLATHVWHAKRFYMHKQWGYWLAKGLPGRGRGARTVLKSATEGAVLHDSSYYSAIQLEGSKEELSRILALALEPLSGWNSRQEGVCHLTAMVHHFGKVPFSPICPATVVFCPSRETGEEKLWVWVHAAAFDEALKSLRLACEDCSNLTCRSRKGELAKLDIFGGKALQLLQKILKARSDGNRAVSVFLSETEEPSRVTSVQLEVYDPRELSLLKDNLPECGGDLKTDAKSCNGGFVTSSSPSFWQNVMDQLPCFGLEGASLWGCGNDVLPALGDKLINKKQQRHRLRHFRLEVENVGTPEWRTCPILLLKYESKSLPGCSIILPASWVHAFWMPLVLGGARVVGQIELRWLMTHACTTLFPFDFPDCPSYKQHIICQLQEKVRINERKPPGKRLPVGISRPAWIDEDMSTISSEQEASQDVFREVKGFFGFIARSVVLLSTYLRLHHLQVILKLDDGSLRPYPEAVDQDKPAGWDMKKACFVRVSVRPASKGVVEEDAVLCAPNVEDFRAWRSRSRNWQGVEMAHGDIIPRRPTIGLVTSAAPWRSRGPTVAFCDVGELSKLQSWQAGECKGDMQDANLMLLFHNPRSTVLRPALASIVLETMFVDDKGSF